MASTKRRYVGVHGVELDEDILPRDEALVPRATKWKGKGSRDERGGRKNRRETFVGGRGSTRRDDQYDTERDIGAEIVYSH